jgi:hypothetical protein
MADETRVEQLYAQGWYPWIAWILRSVFGFLPFSFGDLQYAVFLLVLLTVSFHFLRAVAGSIDKWATCKSGFKGMIKTFAWTWILFHWLWGFNYYRHPIARQFSIEDGEPSYSALVCFTEGLLTEVNRYAPGRKQSISKDSIFHETVRAYQELKVDFPGLQYNTPSFKSSLFGVLGNYLGYGGYYNPFSGEAQINDHMPGFMLPFIGVHEVAHQLGYARESDANFIGYLASMHSSDSSLRYSANLEMFLYANGAVRRSDSLLSRQYLEQLSPVAKADLNEYRSFVKKYHGPLDKITTWFYTRFLQFNNQPEGMRSYNQGMVLLFNYMKKAGKSRP